MKFYVFIGLFLASFGFQAQITNEEIWEFKFYPKSINQIQSLNNGKSYIVLDTNGLDEYSYENFQKTRTLIPGSYSDYKFSSDEKYVLLETEAQPIYRHSKLGKWTVYDAQNASQKEVFEGKMIQEPTFSPDASKVAFVFENNLFIQDLASQKIIQITKDGEKDKIINGICDWVYEEEFAFVRHFDWNAEGTALAFVRFDESEVPKIQISTYEKSLYPNMFEFKYPKAGENNSKVSLYVYDLASQKLSKVDLSSVENYYIPKIKFTNDKQKLFVITSNRHQNEVSVNSFDISTQKISTLFVEKDAAWIDTDKLTLEFLKDNQFIWNSERSGFRHLYLYSADGKKVTPITKGEWEVTEFYGLEEKSGDFYFQSTEKGAINRVVSKSNLKSLKSSILTSDEGYNEAHFSKDFSYFIHTNSQANQPSVYTLKNNSGKTLKVLEDNARLVSIMNEEKVAEKTFLQIPNEAGDLMNAWMIKPSNFKDAEKYPVLMYVYGGPGSQTVENSWDPFNYWWFQSLAQKGYIVISVDGRGTGARGTKYKKVTYKNLGKYEIEDQIAAAKWLGNQKYIDKNRIGMFGWSFGGYMTSLALTKGADVFKTGVAVAPVTNWRYYDTVYTERFMQTPQENANGYDDNSPINYTQLLKGNYLLIHGTADDNVHFQNSVDMIESLVQANKDFDVMVYPDKNHGIYGGKTRLQLYNKMTKFIVEKL